MYAAVVDEVGGVPRYREVADPVAGDGEVVVAVEAVAVENVDRAVVAGTHFTAGPFIESLPAVPCFDGIGRLPDGALVGFGGLKPPHGALAEYAVVPAAYTAPIPDGIPAAIAATLSSAISAMCMQTAAGLQTGETVLVQGATGVAGRLAVQIAKLLGAGRIVATGRDAAALESLRDLGADALIDTDVSDDDLIATYRAERHEGFDVVIDYLWGRPTELLSQALVPEGFGYATPTRLVQIGESAGPVIELSAEAIRTSGLEIYGASRNMATGMAAAYEQVVEWVRTGALTVDVTVMPLSRIDEAWRRTDLRGSRLVVVPDRITEGANRT